MSVNKVILLGNVGDEIKTHFFNDGGSIGRFPLATNESYKNKQGEKVTETQWHNIVVRNKVCEIFEKYVNKGDQIYLEGAIKTRKWQGQDGNERYSTEIHVDNFSFVSGNKSEQKAKVPKMEDFEPTKNLGEETDDLPF